MISVTIRGNGFDRTVTAEVTSTPRETLDEVGYDYSRSLVSIKGRNLNGSSLDTTYQDLGVEDGTATRLTAVVKSDGASK